MLGPVARARAPDRPSINLSSSSPVYGREARGGERKRERDGGENKNTVRPGPSFLPSLVLLQKPSSYLSLSPSFLGDSPCVPPRYTTRSGLHGYLRFVDYCCQPLSASLAPSLPRSLAIATYLIDRRRRQLPFTEGLSEFPTQPLSFPSSLQPLRTSCGQFLVGYNEWAASVTRHAIARLPLPPSLPCDRRRPSERERERELVHGASLPLSSSLAPPPPSAIVVLCPHPSKRHSSRSIFPTYSSAPSLPPPFVRQSTSMSQ